MTKINELHQAMVKSRIDQAIFRPCRVGDILTLDWKNKRYGKARLCQYGNVWIVEFVANKVSFSDKPGPWLEIRPEYGTDARWIHETDDHNFRIVGKV